MTGEQTRDGAIREAGYRAKVGYIQGRVGLGLGLVAAVASGALVRWAMGHLGASEGTAQGVGVLVMVLAAAVLAGLGWRYLRRPVLPDNDEDLEREIRYGWQDRSR